MSAFPESNLFYIILIALDSVKVQSSNVIDCCCYSVFILWLKLFNYSKWSIPKDVHSMLPSVVVHGTVVKGMNHTGILKHLSSHQ